MSILNRAGKLLNEASGFSGMGTAGKVGMAAMLVGLGAKGFYDQVAPATISAGMDVAFGDPQADRKILGTNLTPSLLYGASGLPGAGYARTMNAARFGVGGRSGPINNTVRPAIFGGVAGAAVGTAAVAAAARAAKSPVNPAQLMKGGAKKAAIGAAIGGGLGLAGTITSAVTTARTNEQIITQSPFYNQSALTAERLNASGNIVLGMHNQRRG